MQCIAQTFTTPMYSDKHYAISCRNAIQRGHGHAKAGSLSPKIPIVSSVSVISFSSLASIATAALGSLPSKAAAWVLFTAVASVAVWGRVALGLVHGLVLGLVHGHVVITSLSSFSSLSSSHRVRRCWVGRFAYGLPVA